MLLGARFCQGQPPPARRPALTTADIVILRNEGALLPLQRLDTLRLATATARATAKDPFDFSWHLPQDIADYTLVASFAGPRPADMARLQTHNLLLLALPEGGPHDRTVVRQLLALRKKLIVLVFDSAALTTLPELRQAAAVVLVKARSIQACHHAVQVVFGGLGAAGRLSPTLAQAGFGAGHPTPGGLT